MSKQLLHIKAQVQKSGDVEGVIEEIVASSALLDRQGEIIDQNGWELENFKKNPVLLWGHNVREEKPPIGRAEDIRLEGKLKKKLVFRAVFDMADEFAAQIYRKIKDKFLNTVSVGFIPLEQVDNIYKKSELLEISVVPVPANPQAAVALRSMGVEPVEEKSLYEEDVDDDSEKEDSEKEEKQEDRQIEEESAKRALPFKSTPLAPEYESWDGPGEVAKAEVKDLKIMSAWVDVENEDKKSAYKLVHHKAEGDHAVVWRAVVTSMALLLGAKGGAEIPEEDHEAVYEHLAKHYKQFDKEMPAFRFIQEQILKNFEEEINILSLDREDKYAIRLLKKLLNKSKEKPKSESKKESYDSEKALIDTLKQVSSKLDRVLKGGEKT